MRPKESKREEERRMRASRPRSEWTAREAVRWTRKRRCARWSACDRNDVGDGVGVAGFRASVLGKDLFAEELAAQGALGGWEGRELF